MNDTFKIAEFLEKGVHALILEDNALIALDIESLLGTMGVSRVSSVPNIETALKIMSEDRPDFALVEYYIGQQTTVELAEALFTLNIPFAFVTGIAAPLKLPLALKNSVVLSKPFAHGEFNSLVQGFLEMIQLSTSQYKTG